MFERSGRLLQRKFLDFLLPSVLMSAAVSLAAMLNSIIVGNLLGEEALSVFGFASPIIFCINTVFLMFGAGGVACAAMAKGRRESRDADVFFTLTIFCGLVVMLALMAGLLVFMQPLANALTGGNAVYAALVRDYLTPLVLVGPATMIVMGIALFIRSDGQPNAAARIAIVVNAVNLVLAFVFIKYLQMGIAAAAWSLIVGHLVGGFLLLPYLFSSQRGYRFVFPRRDELARLASLLYLGLPKGLTPGLSFARMLVLNLLITSYLGPVGMTAMTVCAGTLMLVTIVIGGSADTLLPIVATLHGERDYTGIRYVMRVCLRILLPACAILAILFLAVPGGVANLLGVDSAEALAATIPAVRMYALSLPFYGINILLQCLYQATGRPKLASLIPCLEGFFLPVPFALILVVINPDLLWLCFFLAEITTLAVVLAVSRSRMRKEGTDGFLLPASDATGPVLDVTVPATLRDVSGLGSEVEAFCLENGMSRLVAQRMAMALEEMAANISRHGNDSGDFAIDVLVRRDEDKLVASLRDGGSPFDPTSYRREELAEYSVAGIELIKRLADGVEYFRPMGFNSTLITISLNP